MFTVEEREALRGRIIERARADTRVTACALVGSAARGAEDAWSDIDVALRLSTGSAVDQVASEWTSWLTSTTHVADTLDVHGSGALYRVFLLDSSLQLDLSFWPDLEFRSIGGPMRPVFGESVTTEDPNADPLGTARWGWLCALHARSAIARHRSWQAEMMLAELRNQVIALACLRHGLDPAHGRGAHELPVELCARLAASRAVDVEPAEQARCLRETLRLYRAEVAWVDPALAAALEPALDALVGVG